MTISQLFIIIRARLYIFWAVFLFVVISAVIACVVLPKKYKASATVIVNYKWADPISGLTLPAQLMPGYMATQADIITSKDIALKVVDELKLQEVDTFKQDFLKQDEPQSEMRSWL
ncbi:MAG: chain length determinant protein EpsF, partial [Microcystis aeruginosa Ma_MB_F_20061100_S19]